MTQDSKTTACAGHTQDPTWVLLWPRFGFLGRRQRRALVCHVCWQHLGVTEECQ